MELFLDTADIEAIKEINAIVPLKGVTTNPTILTRNGEEVSKIIEDMNAILSPEQILFVQVVAQDYEGIMKEAHEIVRRRKNIYVKIPVHEAGLKAIRTCKEEGIHTLATGIYSANQGYIAAICGATYLAPYLNRMDNYGDGIREVIDLQDMLNNSDLDTKVLAASFKNTHQVHELLVAGVDAATIAPDIFKKLYKHAGTDEAVETFTKDFETCYHRTSLF